MTSKNETFYHFGEVNGIAVHDVSRNGGVRRKIEIVSKSGGRYEFFEFFEPLDSPTLGCVRMKPETSYFAAIKWRWLRGKRTIIRIKVVNIAVIHNTLAALGVGEKVPTRHGTATILGFERFTPNGQCVTSMRGKIGVYPSEIDASAGIISGFGRVLAEIKPGNNEFLNPIDFLTPELIENRENYADSI